MDDVWHVPSDENSNEIVEIRPSIVIKPDVARDLIIQGIRDDLGVPFNGDQLFEGCINPQELANAILNRLAEG